MSGYSALAVLLPLSLCAADLTSVKQCPEGKPHYRTGVRHIEGGGIGYQEGYTTLDLFFASDPSQWPVTPFFDARGHVFDNGKWAANAGVGIRALGGGRVYGFNAYYDYRNTTHFHSNQIGIGVETLGQRFDLRANGYLPVGHKVSHPYDLQFDSFSGNHLLVSQKYQSAMKGANLEGGIHIAAAHWIDLYAAAGPYYFKGPMTLGTWGGKARLAATLKEVLTLEISDSYDSTFHNKFQGQLSLNFSFGPKSKTKKRGVTCKEALTLTDRMLQPVDRQEIIVMDRKRESSVAIDPATGLPYFFVFVSNTGNSNGSFADPYHSFAQAQAHSLPGDILYVFPGDGTTNGMDAGITLQPRQQLWGSGLAYSIQTTQGPIEIPAQSTLAPTITNTDIDTEGHAITLSTNNVIRGFTISSPLADAIYGVDQNQLEVSSCTIENATVYALEADFPDAASVVFTNNHLHNNENGFFVTLNGTSTLVCSDNLFEGQTSVSSIPLTVTANSNQFTATIQNNTFQNNTTGSIRFDLVDVLSAQMNILGNTITNNGTGFAGSLAASVVILPTNTTDQCSLVLKDNLFSDNTSGSGGAHSVYLHTSGAFNQLDVTLSQNTLSHNQGGGIVVATPVDQLTFNATNNHIGYTDDNAIAIIASPVLSTEGTITISNNVIEHVGGSGNGIAINQDFAKLDATISHNSITDCLVTGIVSYAPSGIDQFTLNLSDNKISDCQNDSMGNAASAITIQQYTTLTGSVTHNVLSGNVDPSVVIGSDLVAPAACVTLSGNQNSVDYVFYNPGDGVFNLSPCDVDSVNTGAGNIILMGTINAVQSCSDPVACPSP